MESSPSRSARVTEALESIENSLKVYIGRVKALDDPAFMRPARRRRSRPQGEERRQSGSAIPGPTSPSATQAYRNLYLAVSLHPRRRATCSAMRSRWSAPPTSATKPNSRAAARLYATCALPLVEKQAARREPIYPVARPARCRMVAEQGARISRRRRSRDQAAARQGIARRAGAAAGRRHQARRPGGPQGAVGWRQGGDRRVDRPDDRLCPQDRRQRTAQLAEAFDERCDAPLTAAQAKLADARFAAYGNTALSRRDLHAAHQLRQGCRAGSSAAQPVPTAHHDRRDLRPRDRRRAVRPAAGVRRQRGARSTRTSSTISSPPTTSSAAIPDRR